MPLYDFTCSRCGAEVEKLQQIGGELPVCCEREMNIKPPSNVMVKIKGSGGYPSRRKQIRNTPHPRTY